MNPGDEVKLGRFKVPRDNECNRCGIEMGRRHRGFYCKSCVEINKNIVRISRLMRKYSDVRGLWDTLIEAERNKQGDERIKRDFYSKKYFVFKARGEKYD